MCGINGIFGLENIADVNAVIGGMNDALAHRGPDASGIFKSGNIVLGHRRLSIIDLSESANQPLTSPDGKYTVVYNGELYNYRELKNKLDYPFSTNSDSEVVLAAYSVWGEQCVNAFNGMFAFAVWNNQTNELFVARDRLGIKPLYYARVGSTFVFSSEIRALLASGLVKRKLDYNALEDYLRYQTVHAPHTLVQGVKMLLPGHWLSISDEEQESQCFWHLAENASKELADTDYITIKNRIREELTKSVERRTVADVPIGAFLSGGIDSSVVVGLLAEQSEKPINTFSVTFDEGEYSEAKYAQLIASKFKTNHHEIRLTPANFLEELPNAFQAMDHPSGDGPNTYVVSHATKQEGISVALSGLGGDELFAGYEVFPRLHSLESKKWAMSFPPTMRKVAGSAIAAVKPSIASDKKKELLAQDYWDLAYTYQINRQVFLDKDVRELLNKSVSGTNAIFNIVKEGVGSGTVGEQLPFLSKVSFAEMSTYMQNVLLRDTDQMSMAHALEVRVPFLDHELVQLVMGVHDDHKFPYSPKKLLVESVGDLLPEEIWNRPKMGFTFPWEHWLKNELKPMVEKSIQNLASFDCFNSKKVNDLWQKFLVGNKKVSWSRIWMLVVLEHWMVKNGIEE